MTADPEWQRMALYALGGALLLFALMRLPFIGKALRGLLSVGLLAFCLFLLIRQAPFDPNLAPIAERLGLSEQQVTGGEVRIPMSGDGHFWARGTINGVPRRMLIDSGATVTALTPQTAEEASVTLGGSVVPMIIRTANGDVRAETGTVDALTVGAVEAQGLKIVVSPGLPADILGMNFLSQLASWRVEGKTLILVPEGAENAETEQIEAGAAAS